MTFLDTHVHVWDPARFEYPWLAEAPTLNQSFLPHDIDRDGGRVDRMVFVQADCRNEQALEEARWVASSKWPELVGIVAGADLRSGDALGFHLDALDEVGRVVGIRHVLQGEPVEGFADARLRAGLCELAARGLTFDACVRHAQLPALRGLLASVPPTLSVVIDHLGNPPLAAGIDSSAGRAWAEELRAIAELPNACVKLSGLAPEVCETRTYDQNADAFLEHALQVFGAERAMLGSDWPVSSGRAGSRGFSDWAMRVLRIVGDDADSRAAVKARTGERFYELSVASQ